MKLSNKGHEDHEGWLAFLDAMFRCTSAFFVLKGGIRPHKISANCEGGFIFFQDGLPEVTAVVSAYLDKTDHKVSVHADGGTTEAVWRETDDEMLITGQADPAFAKNGLAGSFKSIFGKISSYQRIIIFLRA